MQNWVDGKYDVAKEKTYRDYRFRRAGKKTMEKQRCVYWLIQAPHTESRRYFFETGLSMASVSSMPCVCFFKWHLETACEKVGHNPIWLCKYGAIRTAIDPFRLSRCRTSTTSQWRQHTYDITRVEISQHKHGLFHWPTYRSIITFGHTLGCLSIV